MRTKEIFNVLTERIQNHLGRKVRFGNPSPMHHDNIASGDQRLGQSKEKKFSVGVDIPYPRMRVTEINEIRPRELQQCKIFLRDPSSWADLVESLDIDSQVGNVLILHVSYTET